MLVYAPTVSCTVHFLETGRYNLAHLRQVLLTLREAKLYVNLKKCSFMQPHVLFLGFIVPEHGISADHEKVRVIRE